MQPCLPSLNHIAQTIMPEELTTEVEEEFKPLTVVGDGYKISIAPEAITRRDDLIAAAAAVTTITTTEEADSARQHLVALADLRRQVEKYRVKVKAPVLDKGKEIDATAKTYIDLAEAEEARLSKVIAAFHTAQEAARKKAEAEAAEERRKAEAEERRLAEEARKLEADRLRLEREAEEARQKQEQGGGLAAFLAGGEDPAVTAQREAAERQAAEVARQQAEALAAKNAAEAKEFTAITAGAAGGVTKKYVFAVTDITAFHAAYPELVKMEVKTAETNKRIADYVKVKGSPPNLPGLVITEEAKVSTRR